MERNQLEGKVIIVTGGTGAFGYSFNHALASEGATVIIIGRNEAKARSRAEEIKKAGGNAQSFVADVLKEEQLASVRDAVINHYGKIDGIVNAAGGNLPGGVVQPEQDVFNLDFNGIRDVIDLNLYGTLLPTQVFGKAMVSTSGRGSIVNISSVSAHSALTKVLGYSLAKSAIESYTKWFSVELANRFGDAIRINAIVPGFFITEQNRTLLLQDDGNLSKRGTQVVNKTPFKRFGKPEELAGALVWLLSDSASFVTGSSIIIDGGFLAFSGV